MKHTAHSLFGLAVAIVASLTGPDVQAQSRSPALLHSYTLVSTPLERFGYSADEIAAAKQLGLAVTDQPAVGSGLQWLGEGHYLSVTDRGPSFTVGTKRLFPLPQFTPTIVLSTAEHSSLTIDDVLPIVGQSGAGVSGIPNSATEDSTPFLDENTPLPYSPNGMDIEDIHMLPGGNFILVEEYSPSVVIVNGNGVVQRRYTPAGKTLPGADYPVVDNLPAIFGTRRANRGFESIAVSPDGQTAYTVTQSPLGSNSAGSPYRESRVVRIVRLDVSDPLNLQVTGQFVVRLSPISAYPSGNAQRDLKVSSAAWVNDHALLFVELIDTAGGGVRLNLIDFANATNIHGLPVADTLDLENAVDPAKGPEALGVVTATAATMYEEYDTGVRLLPRGKLEGITILNRNQVAISNDNDFGVGDVPGTPSRLVVLLIRGQLPLPLDELK